MGRFTFIIVFASFAAACGSCGDDTDATGDMQLDVAVPSDMAEPTDVASADLADASASDMPDLTAVDMSNTGDMGVEMGPDVGGDMSPDMPFVAPAIIATRTSLGPTLDSDIETFEVYLTTAPTEDVVVEFWPDEDAHWVVPMALVFDSQNWDVPQQVTVGIDHDRFVDDRDADLGLTVVTDDPVYAQVSPPQVTTDFFDDDGVSGVISAEFLWSSVSESNGLIALNEPGITLDALPDQEFLVDVRVSDPSVTLTPSRFVAGTGTHRLAFDVADDAVEQAPRLVSISFAVATNYDGAVTFLGTKRAARHVWVIDDDGAGLWVLGDTLEVNERLAPRACTEVVLGTPPADDVAIYARSADLSAFDVVSPQIVFDDTNFFIPQDVCIRAQDDVIGDGDQNAMLLLDATSGDPFYDGLQAMVSVRVTDDELPGYTLYRRRPHVVGETGVRSSFDTLLFANTSPTAAITSVFTYPPNVAGVAADEVVPGWFPLSVRAVDDEVVSGIEQLMLTDLPMTTDPAYATLSPAPLPVVRADTDQPYEVVVSKTWLTIGSGGSDTTAVSLRTQPTGEVTVPVTSYDQTRFTASPAVLVFDSTNWDVPQAVTVTAIDMLGPSYSWLTVGPATGDPSFAGTYAPPVQLQRN